MEDDIDAAVDGLMDGAMFLANVVAGLNDLCA